MKISNNHAKRHYGVAHPSVDITLEDLKILVINFYKNGCACYRCGEPIQLLIRTGNLQISSDRIDSSIGYTFNNIAFSHKYCNCLERHARGHFTQEDYKEAFLRVSQKEEWRFDSDNEFVSYSKSY